MLKQFWNLIKPRELNGRGCSRGELELQAYKPSRELEISTWPFAIKRPSFYFFIIIKKRKGMFCA